MKKSLLIVLGLGVCASGAQAMDYPPNAVPGKCYTRVIVPAKYTYKKENVLVRAASNKVILTQPKYEMVDKLVVTQEASKKLVVVPATYKTIKEKIKVSDEVVKFETVPAKFEKVAKKIMVKPAEKVWKKGRGPGEKIDEATGEIHCLVETPAVYKTVYENVLVKPASKKRVVTPAKYQVIEKRVVDQEAYTKTIAIPEKKGIVKIKQLVEPEKERVEQIPAQYKTITKKVMVSESRPEWRTVLCKTNGNRETIREVQMKLKDQGFDPKMVDGHYGPDTHEAIVAFQKSKKLIPGYMTQETLDALGVNHKL